ncbi:FAD/NAD(P)-binding domain-containing protein [Myriangium duriaei CBS 260.36]|uniref:FAD/NAD(P)-binding domain-containing protein n=1 Tax=Myriangium duriaei CBS 260.36 TaxID=1168546 RepID=A0A9P4J3I1_9PEZI|nr:FAD/NAD(P)-binding domain-containing protein [Myriangium duriaei CBS 260.36]
MANPLKILVSGSGIAGSVFAHWMLRANRNVQITIVEHSPSLRLTGASVDIRSSAIDIIKAMAAEAEIRKNSTNEEGMQMVGANGRPIATFRATGRSDVQSMTSEYEIFRGALAGIFMEPIKDRIKLIFNESVEHYEELEDGVQVTFSSKHTEQYDLLVAADGYGSRIRGQLLNDSPRHQIHDEGVHVAYFTIDKDLLQGSRLAKGYSDTGGRAVWLRPDPAGRTRAMLLNVTWSSNTEMKAKLNKALEDGSYQELMIEMFRDVGWITPQVLAGMRESTDFYCSLFAQVRSPKLCSNRVVLLGDAGYATPGFGTSLAIIGGYVLAGEVMSGDLSSALKRYEDLLLPFVKSQQGDDIAMQLVNPQTRWGINLRNVIMWLVTTLRLDQLAIRASAWIGFTEKKLKMPNYPWPATT